jgi:hypothetical protein
MNGLDATYQGTTYDTSTYEFHRKVKIQVAEMMADEHGRGISSLSTDISMHSNTGGECIASKA